MKILHTSDWHLGNRMMERSRVDEFARFLTWMMERMIEEKPDVLLISGDLFDVSSPGETVRELFSDFLSRVDGTGCHHVILTAGNHDGVAQLNGIRPLLKRYHVHLVTTLTVDSAADCLIPICDEAGSEIGLVCAVPYLRPADVSVPVSDESAESRDTSYIRGIEAVYARVAELATEWKSVHPELPVVAMGHLAVTGAEATSSTRHLIGTLDVVRKDIFSPMFDYVALGHIHKPGSFEEGRLRYCGSPLAMGIDEAGFEHQVVKWENGESTTLPVPAMTVFRREQVKSVEDVKALTERIQALHREHGVPVWAIIEYSSAQLTPTAIREQLGGIGDDQLQYQLIPLREQLTGKSLLEAAEESLTQYSPDFLFERRLEEYETKMGAIDPQKREKIAELFRHIVTELSAD